MSATLAVVISLIVSLPVAGLIIFLVLKKLNKDYEIPEGYPGLFFWLGLIERIIYFFAAYISAWSLIGGWLALKGLAKFGTKDSTDEDIKSFYAYLIGNGLSLLFGVGGAFLAQFLATGSVVVKP
jgi:hypothetical protein